MAKGYQHLTYKQRCQIAAFLQNGKYYYSQAEIARFIRVDKSAISRELQRNSGRTGTIQMKHSAKLKYDEVRQVQPFSQEYKTHYRCKGILLILASR